MALFIFIILAEYLQFASAISILGVFSLISYGVIGRLTDKIKIKKLMRWGAVINFISSILMGFTRTIAQIFGVAAISKFSINLIDMPLTKRSYEKGKKTNIIGYLAFREIMLQVGRVLLLLLFLFLLNLPITEKTAFTLVFIFAGLVGVVYFFHVK